MKQEKEGLIQEINEVIAPIMRVYMLGANGGDETPDQAVQWDFHVHALATLMTEIKNQNS